MNISNDVITDLLPLYLAGEASPGTRQLLEDYLREHPEFAATVREAAARTASLLTAAESSAPTPDGERVTLERVRRFNRKRTTLLAMAIAFGLTMFAFSFEGNRIRYVVLRDSPVQALVLLIAAFICALMYVRMGRRLRT